MGFEGVYVTVRSVAMQYDRILPTAASSLQLGANF